MARGKVAKQGEKPLSGFRKVPKAKDLTPEDIVGITINGAISWLRAKDTRDWDLLATKAAEMYLAGIPVTQIAKHLNVGEAEFKENVDVEKIRAVLDAEVAKMIYGKALCGNEKMLTLIAQSRLGMGKQAKLTVEGEIGVRPVLNISLLTPEDEKRIAQGLPDVETDAEVVDAESDSF